MLRCTTSRLLRSSSTRSTPRTSLLARQTISRRLSTAAPTTAEVWGPRIALISLPLGTGAGLYVWRNYDELVGGTGKKAGMNLNDDDVPRSQFRKSYRLDRSLGKGGFGEVWLAIEKGTGKKVAVKILSLKHLPRAMVEQEVTAMRRCG